jgi:hypothetical protein
MNHSFLKDDKLPVTFLMNEPLPDQKRVMRKPTSGNSATGVAQDQRRGKTI